MFPLSISEMILRLALACVLGGIVGWEREAVHKPAGFRTHILVCIGSTVTMLTSIFIYNRMQGTATSLPDPARLGAQVISGIGFLGAGTIIKEGVNVKGLTTAASLWAVACIGLAIGVGYYSAASVATAFVVAVLIIFNKLERSKVFTAKQFLELAVITMDRPGQLGVIAQMLGDMRVSIHNIKIERYDEENKVFIFFSLKIPGRITMQDVFNRLYEIKGVEKIEQR
ncbi:MAG: putative Mg2+ transporter-C (MgtC) family protein [Clostridiales bacterium]|nr:putative Mg2+ transporter-C (MgtC) family protein [Clostridiales bacterium]